MALPDEVANFLLSRETHITYAISNLDYYVYDFHVDPEGFREMGHLIRQGTITVEPPSRSSTSSIVAVYTPALNKLSVAEGMDLTGTTSQAIIHQSLIIHEITHALMDFHGYQTTSLLQELAAYLAGGIYARSHLMDLASPGNPYSEAVLQAARNVILSHNMMVVRGVFISRSDPNVEQLAQAIDAHPDYSDSSRMVRADGISGGLMNPWYEPRHF